jgi:hypothetical protein
MSTARASDMLIAIWSFCEPEDREAFVSYLAISGYLSNSPSADSANMEPDDVDRSAERASSAVEVGAPVSPEGAAIHRGEPREADAPYGERKPEATLTGAEGFVPPAGTAAEINPSAAHPVEAVADNPQVPRPSAAAKEISDPHSQRLTTGGLHTSSDDAGAKSNGLHSVVGQGGGEPGIHHSQSEQQEASATQARNEPGSVSGATVTNSKSDCRHPDTCKLHFTSALCWSCNDARMRRAEA